MEQKFGKNIELRLGRCARFRARGREGGVYRKGRHPERRGRPRTVVRLRHRRVLQVRDTRHQRLRVGDHRSGIDKEHITWFSFEGEFAGDYPACLDGGPALTTIEAMVPTRMLRVSGEQLMDFFRQDAEKMELRSIIAEHLLSQARARYTDLHRATPLERYELLLRRCPGIARHLPLNAIASFLCITPQQLSRIRKAVTFSEK